jgi:hypothetical protein
MKAFVEISDKQIFEDVTLGDTSNAHLISCLEVIFMKQHAKGCFTREVVL